MCDKPKFLRLHWVDQIAADPKKTADFYSDLLGFKQCGVAERDGYTSYSMTDIDEEEIFGVVEEAIFKHWAPGWVVYFEVEDYEGYCDKIEPLGGETLHRGKNQCLFKDPNGTPSELVRRGSY